MYKKDRTEMIAIRMTPAEKNRLYRYARKAGLTQTEIICRSVDTYIRQRDKKGEFLLQADI